MDTTITSTTNDLPPLVDDLTIHDDTLIDHSMHPFNVSNITVIDKTETKSASFCEGSDSGVEVLSETNFTCHRPDCYDAAYNLLVRRNSTLFEDYVHGDRTSDNGSESSSVASAKTAARRKPTIGDGKQRSRAKPTASVDRLQSRKATMTAPKREQKRPVSAKNPRTPTDDGRWPSINSRPAPLMSRSLRGIIDTPKIKLDKPETKTIEKYATLPRKKPTDESNKKTGSREEIASKTPANRKPMPPRSLLTSNVKKKLKIRIYQENCVQTALTMEDIDKALAGRTVTPVSPDDKELKHGGVQVDMRHKEVEKLQKQLKELRNDFDTLKADYHKQHEKLHDVETKLRGEAVAKESLQKELKMNTERVLTLLGDDKPSNEDGNDSLLVLEQRYHDVSHIVIQQEEEISKLNNYARNLEVNLEKTLAINRSLEEQQREAENENRELQEFMQDEKSTLADALKDAENEIARCNALCERKDKELQEKQDELKRYIKLNDHRWQENLSLQAKLGAFEAKSRELLVHQGSSVSGTAVALTALINRLDGLVGELVNSYNISEQELEDVIYHNEAYSHSSSSPDATPEKAYKFPDESPKKGSSFVSAVINAIRNAAAQSSFITYRDVNKDNISADRSPSNEMLDSETEPCLMMEHVLEDVVVPDGHSHNMISSSHSLRLTQSDSLKELSRSFLDQTSMNASFSSEFSVSDVFSSVSLVDQVIDVDNLVTKLLKVIRIIQLENDDCMNELQEQRDSLERHVAKERETNKFLVKQLKEWETLGANLKGEVRELMAQLAKKNNELENMRCDLCREREQVEKLNQDVCELSTALAKMKIKEEQVLEAIKNLEVNGEIDDKSMIGNLIISQKELVTMKDKLNEKERHLSELTQEFLSCRQVLSESLKEAISETKKQYEAIDNALEVLHSNQSVVQQCKPLADLQRDLESVNFQTASTLPLAVPADYNANAGLMQAIANVASPINTTA